MKASEVLDNLKRRFPNEPEYHQAVSEVLGTIEEVYNEHPEFEKSNLIERLCIPDRIFSFRVTWMDDKGQIQTNMGYRIQHNNAIGPYKGGIRFHASVNQSILKFLAFEQTFKNSLTTLPMGGGKGGSDFSQRGKANADIMRFCQALVLELWRHIGPDTDVPAGDIGVGGREVGYMYGMYKKLAQENTGTFTGKGREFGGSLIRPEATGYGNVYFLLEMLKTPDSIIDWCTSYLVILMVGCAGSAYYNILCGILRGLGDSISALIYLLVATVFNIVLDIVFVSQFHMGVAGVAYATVIAQAISAVLCMWRLMRMTDIFDFRPKYLKMKKQYSMEIIRLGLPSGITQAIFSMAMVIVQSLTNSFGEMVIAANVIIMRVDGFAMMPNFSFGTAMTTYAGQNVGARRMDRVEQGAKQGTLVAVGTSTTITLLIVIFGHHLMGIFTNTTELVTLSANMMKILAVGYIAMAIPQSLSGVMRGAGDTMTPMWISMVVTVVIRVPLAYDLAFLTRTPELPNGRYQVLWISMLVSWCMGALLTLIFYKKGNWKKKALTGSSSEK